MLKIGITGANGFLGWHLRSFLHTRKDFEVLLADRSTFDDPVKLRLFVSNVDAVAHIAGINRGSDSEIFEGNVTPVRKLVAAMEVVGARPHVLFANSIQHARNTAYALSKRAAAGILAEWSLRNKAPYANLILPHLFGEGGRPFYNSAVTTFCYQIAKGMKPEVLINADIELIHAQRVAEKIIAVIEKEESGDIRVRGKTLKVSEALAQISKIAIQYKEQIIPSLSSEFELDIFNTYRSYLFPDHYPISPELHSDPRGSLFECVKTLNGGQCFISTTLPSITRGNHFHRRKLERFVVMSGEAVIRLRKLLSQDVFEFRVSGEFPQFVDIPTLHTHSITNVGKTNLLTLFWSHEIFDPTLPDTFAETV
jgi:UDP-2-acetamido-2,6-beta-L-arabino-hexul-4-ose reductase